MELTSGSNGGGSSKTCVGVLRVPFPSSRLAHVACACLQVDDELQAGRISRDMAVEEPSRDASTDSAVLVVTFRAENTKLLRVSMSSFTDLLLVSIKTMQEFDE